MKANDILLAHNGYSDMYYFLQVVKATAKTVTLKRIYANHSKGTPCPNQFNDSHIELKKRVSDDGRVVLGGWTVAELWNGEPVQNKHPMWGLNYNLY